MKFSIKQAALQQLLNTTTKAISNKVIIPVLSGIKFDVEHSKIRLTGSSNTLTITDQVIDIESFNVETAGSFVLPSKYISDIVRKTRDEWINFEIMDTNLLYLYTSTTEFTLKCFDISEYPNTHFIENEASFVMKIEELRTIINQTIFCVSTNASRPPLTGINFKISGRELIATGSDSFRLSQKETQILPTEIISNNIIIPEKSASELNKLLAEVEDEDITIHVSNNKMLFIFDSIKIQTNLIEGKYPDTSRAIPQNFEIEIEVARQLLLQAVDLATLLSRDVHNNIVTLTIEGDNLNISSLSEEVGQAKEDLAINVIKGADFKIAVNGQFIIDALRSTQSKVVTLKFNDEFKPFIIDSIETPDLVQLIVPLRTH